MLTALTVTQKTENMWFKKLLNHIKGNKIKVDIKQVRGVTLRHIEYINRIGKINWNEIDKYVGIQRNHLLCSEYLELPVNMGYKRFESQEFNQRLCTNMALYVLGKIENPQNLNVCFYDINGENADYLIHLLKYCPEAKVISDNREMYAKVSELILEETGISPIICENVDCIENCDFLIAPCVINERLPIKNQAITLTSACPKIAQNGAIYFRYHFKMPNKFETIKPAELSDIYFASALYTKARQHQFGSIVPMICSNYSGGSRIESICAYFASRA
ncbi:MAG: hypothetical protein J1E56_00445 [Ruminococcus sp.]|nr:hypothetical protein [Ruminococcus sp.]